MSYADYWARVETPSVPLPAERRDAHGRLAPDSLAIIEVAGRKLATAVFGPCADVGPLRP